MVAALLAVTIAAIAIVSTRVAHYEIRKVDVSMRQAHLVRSSDPLRDFYLSRNSWSGVQPALDRVAEMTGSRVVLFDGQHHFIAISPELPRPSHVEMTSSGGMLLDTLRSGVRAREIIQFPLGEVKDAAGRSTGFVFMLPSRELSELPAPTRALDISFFWTFAIAALFGVIMAVAIARWTTIPIVRLTNATRRMETGDLTVRVEPSGGTELAELARGFNAMAESLDRNEELRRRMVSDVAHELRAPLTNIRCELESMQDGLVAPTPDRIESLHQETMHLARLVDDLQDLALADAGRLEIHREPVALDALARRAATSMEMRAHERNVTITVDGPSDVIVLADPTRAVQIITNLLANAVTYMQKPGEVRIEWRRNGAEAVVDVIDEGVGIAKDQLERVFDRFYRVDDSRSRHTGGAGLGLSIVQQLVTAHGGRVGLVSEVGSGSTFSFTLPVV
jgi:two-component system, OmpR family, sensor histidine kinase BaeS